MPTLLIPDGEGITDGSYTYEVLEVEGPLFKVGEFWHRRFPKGSEGSEGPVVIITGCYKGFSEDKYFLKHGIDGDIQLKTEGELLHFLTNPEE